MVELSDLVELQDLVCPVATDVSVSFGATDQELLLADLLNVLLEGAHLGPAVGDAREDIRQQGEQERNVLGNQLGHLKQTNMKVLSI